MNMYFIQGFYGRVGGSVGGGVDEEKSFLTVLAAGACTPPCAAAEVVYRIIGQHTED